MSDEGHETHCPVDGCPGDYRYAPPGRGHTCTTETWLTAQAPAGAAADDEAGESLLRDIFMDPAARAAEKAAADDEAVEALALRIQEGVREHGNSLNAWQAIDAARVVLAAGYLPPEHVEQQAREREAEAWNRGWEDAGQWRTAENIASARRLPMPPVPENPYRADRGGDRG